MPPLGAMPLQALTDIDVPFFLFSFFFFDAFVIAIAQINADAFLVEGACNHEP
jgi:hypothetical protein